MPAMHPLIAKVRHSARSLGLEGQRVLVAVSGGPDSVALLLALVELREQLGLELHVATIDHQLRAGSGADARYVQRLAARLGVPFSAKLVRVVGEGGIEAAARRERYRALEQLRRREGCAAVVTGHTLEDQAETVLLRLTRGAGVRGLRGILPRRRSLVRPMLEVSRAEVASFLASCRIRPRLDPTNASAVFARNRVRALVLPAIAQALGEPAIAALARSAEIAGQDDAALEKLARRKAARILRTNEAGVGGDTALLLALEPALQRRVLRRAARLVGLNPTRERVLAMLAALQSKKPRIVQLSRTVEFDARYGGFLFRRRRGNEGPRPFERLIPGEGRWRFEEGAVEVRAVTGPGKPEAGAILLDPEHVELPLRLRSRRPGDLFRSRGGRQKKLKAFLIDRKLPREERDALPLLADSAGRVLWIVGVAQGDAALEGERARRAWQVRFVPSGERHARAPVKRTFGDDQSPEMGPPRRGPKAAKKTRNVGDLRVKIS